MATAPTQTVIVSQTNAPGKQLDFSSWCPWRLLTLSVAVTRIASLFTTIFGVTQTITVTDAAGAASTSTIVRTSTRIVTITAGARNRMRR